MIQPLQPQRYKYRLNLIDFEIGLPWAGQSNFKLMFLVILVILDQKLDQSSLKIPLRYKLLEWSELTVYQSTRADSMYRASETGKQTHFLLMKGVIPGHSDLFKGDLI